MKLFPENPNLNLLPYNGTVNYYGRVFAPKKAQFYFERLMQSIDWRNDEAVIFGKRIVTARKVAWYGDEKLSLIHI